MTTWDVLDICKALTEHKRKSDILYTLNQLSTRVSQNGAPLTFDEKSIDAQYLPIVDAILYAEKIRRKEDEEARNKAESTKSDSKTLTNDMSVSAMCEVLFDQYAKKNPIGGEPPLKLELYELQRDPSDKRQFFIKIAK